MPRHACLIAIVLLCLHTAAQAGARHEQARDHLRAGDYAKAYCLLRPLAEQGDPDAAYTLGWMYHNGYGLAIDDAEAEAWWQRAAARGNADALFALGQLWQLGGALGKDSARAVDFYQRAAGRGHEDARQLLRVLLAQGKSGGRERLLDILETDPDLLGGARTVSARRANVRAGPGTNHRILATLTGGDALVELGRKGNWIRVGLAGTRRLGWMHKSLVK